MERNLMNNRSLVCLCPSNYCVELRTVSMEKKSARFLINRASLLRYLENEPYNSRNFMESDLHSYLSLFVDSCGRISVKIAWLNSPDGNLLKGYVERLSLPFQPVLEAVKSGNSITVLTLPDDTFFRARLVFAPSVHARIAKMSVLERRAFTRCLVSHFHWPDATVMLYADGKHDFFFKESRSDGTTGVCGGLIYNKSCDSRGFPKIRYEMCT